MLTSFWRLEIRLGYNKAPCYKAFGGWKFDWGTTKFHAKKVLEDGNSTGLQQSSMLKSFWKLEGWKFDRGTTKLHAKKLFGNSTGVQQNSILGF